MICLHITNVTDWIVAAKWVLSFYPPFHFSKLYNDLAVHAGNHPDVHSRLWVPGEPFSWGRLAHHRSGWFSGAHYYIPNAWVTLGELAVNILIISVLAWYFDHVLPGNRGAADPPYFFLTPQYWNCRRRKQPSQVPHSYEMQEIDKSTINDEVRKVRLL